MITKANLNALNSVSIPVQLMKIAELVRKASGHTYIVGGWVRDILLNIPSNDYDLEVYGLEADELLSILRKFGRPNTVGRAFGVIIMTIDGINFDFAFPRTETKTGSGHKGFMVKPDKNLTFSAAAERRDFTINAMGFQIPEMRLEDPHNGLKDLESGILRHVSPAFSEDPLRALRAVYFAARFDLEIERETQELCSRQPLDELPPERIFQEFKKLLMKTEKPSIGLEWMRKMDLLRFFPELKDMVGVQQDPDWHPEGDVWDHNNRVIDEAAIIRDHEFDEESPDTEFEKLALMLGALCHDLGKPATTIFKDGHWRSPAHDVRGERITRQFLSRITRDTKLIQRVTEYVREHLKPALYYNVRHEIKPSTIRRLALHIDIEKLVRFAKADHFGRLTRDAIEKRFEAGEWLLEQSQQLKVLNEKPVPLLSGKMLLKLGMKPGPEIGAMIRESFEEQLEQGWEDPQTAFLWAKEKLAGNIEGQQVLES